MPCRGFNEKGQIPNIKIMGLIIIWMLFIITMSLGVIGEGLDTFNYLLYGFTMLYITYIFKQL
jgi:uncharacterized membrane protein YciS (DUF1049 family)